MLSIKTDLEKVIDFKTTIDSKIESIGDRLKRLEKIIDRLQLSVLQKVGDYITNVDEIKNELVEMEKSFKSLHTHHVSSSHPQSQHNQNKQQNQHHHNPNKQK